MAIIKVYPDTIQGKQDKLRDTLSAHLTNQFRSIQGTFESARSLIWENNDGLTPQQAFDAFGNEAGKLIQASLACSTLINTLFPNTVDVNPPHPVTVNQDGTVTVGE